MKQILNKALDRLLGVRIIRTANMASTFEELNELKRQLNWLRDERLLVHLPNTPMVLNKITEIGNLLSLHAVPGAKKIRLGSKNDGGYIHLDRFDNIIGAISLGIDGDAFWDLDVASRGIKVFQYDHTIEAPPIPHKNFFFHRVKISNVDGNGCETIPTVLKKNELSTPSSVIGKIDIEGDEWSALLACPDSELKVFSQFSCEFHFFERIVEPVFCSQVIAVLQKLSKHFAAVHIHANNCAPLLAAGNFLFPSTLEVTFANRESFSFDESTEIFPGPLDTPNDERRTDYQLGYFKFG
jgi:hypothetical protein